MKSAITPKSLAVWFLVVLALYLASFYGMEHWNQKNGPWEVAFVSDETGLPSVLISQPKLNITKVKIVFAGERASQTNLSQKVFFDRPATSLPVSMPIGEVIYQDLRAMPGVVTFNFFGHEVELLPRVLIANKKEIRWKSGSVIELTLTNKPAQPPRPPKGWTKE